MNEFELVEKSFNSMTSSDDAWKAFKQVITDDTNLDYVTKLLMVKKTSKARKLLALAFDPAAPEGEARSAFMRIRAVFLRSKVKLAMHMEGTVFERRPVKENLSNIFKPGTEQEIMAIMRSMKTKNKFGNSSYAPAYATRNVRDHWAVKLPDGRSVLECMHDDPAYLLKLRDDIEILAGDDDRLAAVMWAVDDMRRKNRPVDGI